MKRFALAVPWLLACSGPAPRPPTTPAELPPATTVCYAGRTTGMGQTARTITRRTVDPAAKQITKEGSNDDAAGHGAKSFHVVMSVDGDSFTMTETGGAFTGTGTLVGEPWKWTSWTSTSQIPNTEITVESDEEITSTGMTATKEIKQAGKVVATTTEELKTFDCTEWDQMKAALTVPALDTATCERACRNFATLKFWHRADAEIATLPPADQAAARTQQESELATKLDGGVSSCATECMSANNAVQTTCMADAKSVDQLAACE